ncbi:MAG: transcription elongation factor GreA [Anaerovoracaceae bacterium]|jgi:transcription elongation factor GreA
MADEILLSQKGYDKLVAEYDELVSVRRKEVSERLKTAISYGDLSENAEYDSAKNEQAELEERINRLELTIKTAKIVSEDDVSIDQVNLGLTVEIKDLDNGKMKNFIIVGSNEADPFAEPAKISSSSPVGRGLLGKRIGDDAEIEIPLKDGRVRHLNYEVLNIYR